MTMTRLQATTMPKASSGAYPVVSTQSIRPMGLSEASLSSVPAATARKAVKTWAVRRKTKRTIRCCVICIVCRSQYLTNAQTEHRHHHPWCGGDNYGLTWGVIGPQAMVWAEAAGRHDQRKTWCVWWNRGRKQGGKSIVAYGTFSTRPS